MELKEAINKLEELGQYESVVENHEEAISIILHETEHLKKENKELKDLLEEIILGGENWFEKKPYKLGVILGTKKRNEYWLNKIRKKIEELEEMLKKTIEGEIQRYTPGDIRLFISCLQDLLKEE